MAEEKTHYNFQTLLSFLDKNVLLKITPSEELLFHQRTHGKLICFHQFMT